MKPYFGWKLKVIISWFCLLVSSISIFEQSNTLDKSHCMTWSKKNMTMRTMLKMWRDRDNFCLCEKFPFHAPIKALFWKGHVHFSRVLYWIYTLLKRSIWTPGLCFDILYAVTVFIEVLFRDNNFDLLHSLWNYH